jgi:hypothetical protein
VTATYEQAKDEMFGLVLAQANITALGIHIEWQGKANNVAPPQDGEWLRVSVRHDPNGSRQASLSCEQGKRRWRREGVLSVQCFAPQEAGGLKRAMELACAFRDAIQASKGTASGVWFREPNAREIGPDKNWFNANASARFTYDEVN